MKTIQYIVAAFLASLTICGIPLSAQDVRDTLRESTITESLMHKVEPGRHNLNHASIGRTVSAIGEKDAVKYVQTLPGISMGIEGGNAYFARGGNLGGNMLTLDDIPVYGSGHLFGLTSVYSPEIVDNIDIAIGGFSSDEDNLTASHVRVKTTDEFFNSLKGNASASSFMLGGSAGKRILDNNTSLFAAARISPAQLEWYAMKGLASSELKDLSTGVYDIFLKMSTVKDANTKNYLSFFNSLDAYRYSYGSATDNSARWANLILNWWRERTYKDGSKDTRGLSFNRYSGMQASYVNDDTENALAIRSALDELEYRILIEKSLSRRKSVSRGAKIRLDRYSPGSTVHIDGPGVIVPKASVMNGNYKYRLSAVAHIQEIWRRKGKYEVKAAGRIAAMLYPDRTSDDGFRVIPSPSASFSARKFFGKHFGLEATLDYLTMYNHVLEGIPMGWSIDMLVPSDIRIAPEHTAQGYSGLFSSFGNNSITAGAFYKRLWNLAYFEDAASLFSPSLAGWENNIVVGDGWSYGAEFLYEYHSASLSGRVAYTWSKTDRRFPGINNGEIFPAKFDRRHILNVGAEYVLREDNEREMGFSAFFTYQSGLKETVPEGELSTFDFFGNPSVPMSVFSGSINNYTMPAYIRMDAGVFLRFKKAVHPSVLNVGIYNILNRHNPFAVYYDTEDKVCKQISLFPILPSFSYRVEF